MEFDTRMFIFQKLCVRSGWVNGLCTSGFDDFFFEQLYCPFWDFSHGKFGVLSPGKASCDRVALPNLRCMHAVFVFP